VCVMFYIRINEPQVKKHKMQDESTLLCCLKSRALEKTRSLQGSLEGQSAAYRHQRASPRT